MADTTSSIFNKRATEKLRSPDDLDKYVRVTNPSIWAVLGASVAILIGLLAWGIFGSVTTSVSCLGVVYEDEAMCFLSTEDVTHVNVGDVANFGGTTLVVSEVARVPFSEYEIWDLLQSDYLSDVFSAGGWVYRVDFEGDVSGLEQGVPLGVSITTERVAPISLIFGGTE